MTVVVSHHSTITRMKAAVALVVAAALEVMTLPVRAVVGQMYMITATTTTAMVALAVEASRMEDPPMKSKTLNQPSAQCRMLLVDLPLLACSRLS
jgi:hypothetical protein